MIGAFYFGALAGIGVGVLLGHLFAELRKQRVAKEAIRLHLADVELSPYFDQHDRKFEDKWRRLKGRIVLREMGLK